MWHHCTGNASSCRRQLKALENQLEMKLVKKTARLKLSEQARDIINRFEILEKYIEQLLQKTNQNFTKLIRNNKQ